MKLMWFFFSLVWYGGRGVDAKIYRDSSGKLESGVDVEVKV